MHAIQDVDINFIDAPLQQNLPHITFTDRDFKGINLVNQDNPMVVSIIIVNFIVSRVHIDQGSSIDILYWKTFQRLKVSADTVHPHVGPLPGFVVERIELEATWT